MIYGPQLLVSYYEEDIKVDEFQGNARHKAHDQMNTLSAFERDNLMENLILVIGLEGVKQAANQITGEQTLLALCGKEVE